MKEETQKPLADPPKNEPAADKKRGLIGMRYGDMSAISWDLDNANIVCTAHKLCDDVWTIEGRNNNELRITAQVFGGKNAAKKYLVFIRRGMKSRAMRRKGKHEADNLDTPHA